MNDRWNFKVECCGNCAFWPLATNVISDVPFGIGGPHTDGSVSECRRHAPTELDRSKYPNAERRFPTTAKRDFCGDFELRG